MIFTRDFVTRENYWEIASFVTQKSLLTVTHALFFIYIYIYTINFAYQATYWATKWWLKGVLCASAPSLTRSVYVLVTMSQWMAQCIVGSSNCGVNTLFMVIFSIGRAKICLRTRYEFQIHSYVTNITPVSADSVTDTGSRLEPGYPFQCHDLSHIIAWISNDVHCFCGMQFPIHVLNLAKPLLQLGTGTLIKIIWK